MLITIQNLTTEPLIAHTHPTSAKFGGVLSTELSLLPSLDLTTTLPKGFRREIILRHQKECHTHPEGFRIQFSMTFASSWQFVPVLDNCPWRVFVRCITRGHHKLLILARRNLSSFLSEMPDRLPLSSLVLPGTHDTMAFHGWPISQCQSPSTPLTSQFLSGIRVIDIRLAVIPAPVPGSSEPNPKQQLIAYHGLWPQKTPFRAILKDIQDFLASPTGQKETIIMSVKQEDFAITPASLFSQLVRSSIVEGPGGWDNSKGSGGDVNRGMWFLENRIPTLGEVRGKVVMLSRFGGNGDGWEGGLEGLGIHPTTWPDSDRHGFEWELKGTVVRTHDWYGIPSFFSIPEKVQLGTANLIPPADSPKPVLPITYFSAASFPLAFPPTVAKGFGWPKWGLGIEGVNSKLGAWLLDQLGGDNGNLSRTHPYRSHNSEKEKIPERTNKHSLCQPEPRVRGWIFLDYFSEPEGSDHLVPLLVECNYRGRKTGEEEILLKKWMSNTLDSPSVSQSTTTTANQSEKPKNSVPKWVPVSAFIGTSIVVAIPLLLLRRQRGSVARLSLKGSAAPPPRRVSGTAAALPVSSTPATTASISLHETIKESLNEESTSLMSALSRMNASSAILAAKAFGIATSLVALTGFGVACAVKTALDVQDTREFGHRMRTLLRLTAPGMMARIRRPPETEEERHQAHSLAPFGSHEAWNWLDAEKRLQKAYEEGGFPLWAQTALREMEAEARFERTKREEENEPANH